jgi:ribosomal protein S18 acetylase RimI-like enzyme
MVTFPAEVAIVPLTRQHARAAAELHVAGIHAGFISSLGIEFVTALYEALSDRPGSFGFVALIDGRVAGVVALTVNVKRLYQVVLRRSAFRFSVLLCRKMLSLESLKKILETLFYPRRIKNLQLPEAEMLSMAVAPAARFYGLGPQLIRAGFEEYRKRGIREVKILAAESLQPINKMYRLLGFQVRTKIINHGVSSNIYVVPADFFHSCSTKRREPTGA